MSKRPIFTKLSFWPGNFSRPCLHYLHRRPRDHSTTLLRELTWTSWCNDDDCLLKVQTLLNMKLAGSSARLLPILYEEGRVRTRPGKTRDFMRSPENPGRKTGTVLDFSSLSFNFTIDEAYPQVVWLTYDFTFCSEVSVFLIVVDCTVHMRHWF